MTLGAAIDAYLDHLATEGRSRSTRVRYRTELNHLAGYERADFQQFLSRLVDKSPATLAFGVTLIRGFSAFLYDHGVTEEDHGRKFKRPRRQQPEDLNVTTISTEDAGKLLAACIDRQERLCMGAALYLGWRRGALSRARRSDVDLERGTMRVLEKGGKMTTKWIPDEYLCVLREADEAGVWDSPSAYLIPNRAPTRTGGERSDKVIWMTVKRVAARAGVHTHVHALRAAFAVAFMEQENDAYALQKLMGHRHPETTEIYLRRLDKARATEKVRNLSFGTGLEPVIQPDALVDSLLPKPDPIRTKEVSQ